MMTWSKVSGKVVDSSDDLDLICTEIGPSLTGLESDVTDVSAIRLIPTREQSQSIQSIKFTKLIHQKLIY
jgi:hypothetical protein